MSEPIMNDQVVDIYAETPEPVARNTAAQERQLLASLLVWPQSATDDVLDLPAEHFTGERHQQLWKVLVERAGRGLEADVPAVVAEFDGVPGMADFISRLAMDSIGALPSTFSTLAQAISQGHADRVTEATVLRAWQHLAAGHGERARHVMASVDPDEGKPNRSVTLTEAWEEALAEAVDGVRVIPTPWTTLNAEYLHGGWKAREVYFVAGSPGVGKTAAGQLIATHTARHAEPCLVFSLEMARTDLARRMLSTAGKIDMAEMMRHDLTVTADTLESVRATLAEIGDRVRIVDDMELTISQIRAQARRDARRHGCGLVVVDYAQLVQVEDPRLSERERIELVAAELKAMAKELDVPVVALAQPNRNAVLQGRKLEMQDLHGSGALERVGAMVLLLNRVMDQDENGEPVETPFVEFDIAKNRYGRRGRLQMLADLSRQTFEEAGNR